MCNCASLCVDFAIQSRQPRFSMLTRSSTSLDCPEEPRARLPSSMIIDRPVISHRGGPRSARKRVNRKQVDLDKRKEIPLIRSAFSIRLFLSSRWAEIDNNFKSALQRSIIDDNNVKMKRLIASSLSMITRANVHASATSLLSCQRWLVMAICCRNIMPSIIDTRE